MKLKVVILSFVCFFLVNAQAQDYKTAIGFKGGFPGYGALNVKHFLGGSSAIDFSVGGGANHLWLQGLYEINNPLQDGFSWYYGIGADVGFWNRGYMHYYKDKYYNNRTWFGIDGVLGIEYTFNQIPINLAVEAVPTVRVSPYVGFGMGGAFAIRFAIK